ncbi:helix-turn-helix domain-containing protein [Listeria booriae]|uniref:Helix-turn-helix transcriptional regulator n=1 Tax=Listeria booriae TaxID=1552123 RepID=A0A842G4R0_9LIST|nr:helix-turn-helix transcriptional regulator [Listeria booriae]MBC2100591.1 helix-turn-helix transcriptional regulator [Listeria booriae]MBC2196857.1 helix-turn-helix transcriptional regulator [Listeria booriae]MBC2293716.1 helix-turn-helix transcriptional regulator [Listeria booriae]
MFGEILMRLRKQKKLTQEELASVLGVARTTYSSYEQNRRMPDAEIQNKIADYFNVSLDYLHGRQEKDNDGIAFFDYDDLDETDLAKIEGYIEALRQQKKDAERFKKEKK